MSDIVEFLRARLDEDEAAARAASPGGWTYNGVDSVSGGMFYDETRTIGTVYYEQPDDHDGRIVRHLLTDEADANGAHIARHDPARVLREVEAKRAILDALADAEQAVSGYDNGNPDNPPSYWQEWGNRHALALTVEHLAAVYADHPDYRQEWA